MNYKTKLIAANFGLIFFLVAAFGLGWDLFLKHNYCANSEAKIWAADARQDSVIMTFALFGKHKDPEKKALMRQYTSTKEMMYRAFVEDYSRQCRGRHHKAMLLSFLKSHETYLKTKDKALDSRIDLSWIRAMKDPASRLQP